MQARAGDGASGRGELDCFASFQRICLQKWIKRNPGIRVVMSKAYPGLWEVH